MAIAKIYTLTALPFIILIIIFGYYNLYNDEPDPLIQIAIMERSIQAPLNQGVCHHPNLPIDNPEIMKFYKPVEKLNCGNRLDDWVICKESICFVRPEVKSRHGEVTCYYYDLIRDTDYKVKYDIPLRTKDPYVLRNSDFVRVECSAEDGEGWTGMAYGIRDNVRYSLPDEISSPAKNSQYFNVLMFGFDSMSRNAVMRKLPKTYKYLTSELNATVLKGYNIVGDATLKALLPMLTGYNELELPDARRSRSYSHNVNVYPFIWKKYKKHGYITSYNEDCTDTGTFATTLKGFDAQPVDHYMRTFYIEVENNWNESTKFCIGHHPTHVVMCDYTTNLMSKYKESPHFIFSFHSKLTHGYTNEIEVADDDLVGWLHGLKEEHFLDNTILIFMADHGNRYAGLRATLQGKQEERLPFFSFAFPETFKQRFTQQYENFLQNSERLTTPYDIHATLDHLLTLQTSDSSHPPSSLDVSADIFEPIKISALSSKRSISLFDIISPNRSCADAYIEPHWCACLIWQQLPLHEAQFNATISKLAASIMDTLNEATKEYRHLCAPLELHKIMWAMRLLPHKNMLDYNGKLDRKGFRGNFNAVMRIHEQFYQLQITVMPGESLFEATVSYNIDTLEAATKLSDISRINKYGSQANCIYKINPGLRKFCYCRT